jgi:hypothetical protein
LLFSVSSQELIRQYFREAYPLLKIADLRFAYNVRVLEETAYEHEVMTQARLKAEEHNYRHNTRLKLLPFACGNTVSRLCPCMKVMRENKEVDAVEYYGAKEQALSEEVSRELVRSTQEPVGIFFVSFCSFQDAFTFYR